jgi:hypothetical protein
MPLKFTNLAKGHFTQSIAKMLFERAGYRVTRLGIEELFSEIIYLDQEQYNQLGLPDNLRFLPDLLIATREMDFARLVEVKFRLKFDDLSSAALYRTLSRQFDYWSDAVCVLMVAESVVQGGKFHQDYIRTIDKTLLRCLDVALWNSEPISNKLQRDREPISSSHVNKIPSCSLTTGSNKSVGSLQPENSGSIP